MASDLPPLAKTASSPARAAAGEMILTARTHALYAAVASVGAGCTPPSQVLKKAAEFETWLLRAIPPEGQR